MILQIKTDAEHHSDGPQLEDRGPGGELTWPFSTRPTPREVAASRQRYIYSLMHRA